MAGFPKELNISQNLNVGDIEIGAVELKDASTDTRAAILAITSLTSASVGMAVGSFQLPTIGKTKQTTTITSSTAETTIVSAEASRYHDIYGLKIANKSATGTLVTIRDDTGGTAVDFIYVPAAETRGYMLSSSDAFPQTAVNKNWTAQCGTSVDSVYITVNYVSLASH